MKFGSGRPVPRREDVRFLTGSGSYLDDAAPEGQLVAAFLRSPVAHATLHRVDTSGAVRTDGVVRVYTGADFESAGINDIGAVTLKNRDGSRCARPKRPLLAVDRLRTVGEPVALVVARSVSAAREAAERIEVEYEEIPAVVTFEEATAEDAPRLHEEAPRNVAYRWAIGDEAAVDAQIASAPHRVELALVNNRVAGCPLETRGAIACWKTESDSLELRVSAQNAWRVQREVAARLGLGEDRVRVRIGDVGGGFGTKAPTYPEYTAIAFAALDLRSAVRWIADRSEAFQSDAMGRDHRTRAVAAFDEDLRLVAMRVESDVAMGAYLSPHGTFIPSELVAKVLPGAYDFEHLFFAARGVYTNTTPVDAYRGAGRPEGIYVVERLMDLAARQFGVDPIRLRLRNFVPAHRFPYRNATGETMDSGDYRRVAERARREADVEGFPARRAESARRGRLRGLGIAYYVEIILGLTDERAELGLAADGTWELLVGTQSFGQGHETAYLQLLADCTGLDPDRVRIVQGDTARIPVGGGTGGSRSVTTQGTAILAAADKLVDALRPEAEEALEAAREDVEFAAGAFRIVGSDLAIGVDALAERIVGRGERNLLRVRSHTELPARSFPNGCHICEAEVDPETGRTIVDRYLAVDDFGRLVNPLLVRGQVHGGVAQGIGQALFEHVVLDEDGQPLTGSFMDYALPRAGDVPPVRFLHEPVPSPANPLGVKGCGEAGTIGALPATVNAVLDAVWQAGVRHVDMPLTPVRVWGWLEEAREAARTASANAGRGRDDAEGDGIFDADGRGGSP